MSHDNVIDLSIKRFENSNSPEDVTVDGVLKTALDSLDDECGGAIAIVLHRDGSCKYWLGGKELAYKYNVIGVLERVKQMVGD
jgi:hypothetical protein